MGIKEFEKQQKILKAVRFLAFPLGWAMYLLTIDAFGQTASTILSVVACVGFWIIVSKGRDKSFYDALAKHISETVSKVGYIEHSIEMRPLAGGLILRIYLVNPGEKADIYNKAIYNTLTKWNASSRPWAVQIASVASIGQIERIRASLDEELLEEMKKEEK